MPSYAALIRGINVSGHNPLSMPDLRAVVESVTGPGARTYLQSGNVVFRTDEADGGALAVAIRDELSARRGLSVEVLVRTAQQLEEVLAANPFLGEEGLGERALHVTFLASVPDADRVAAAEEAAGAATGNDRFRMAAGGSEVYLCCPGGYGRTKLNNAFFERKLAVPATTRNWRTVTALAELARP